MSRPSTPSKSAPTRSHREDVLQFLDNLDSFEGGAAPTGANASSQSARAGGLKSGGAGASTAGVGGKSGATGDAAANPEDAQSVLDFLDEIVTSRDRNRTTTGASATLGASSGSGLKRPTSSASAGTTGANISRSGSRTTLRGPGDREDGTASPAAGTRKSTESARSLKSSYLTPASTAAQAAEKLQDTPASTAGPSTPSAASADPSGGWGWGSVWSQASNVIQQARTVAEEQVSKNLNNLPKNLPASISSLQSQLPVSPSSATQQGAAALSNASGQAQKWRSGVINLLQSMDVEKLRKDITETGLKAMSDIMNAVAPPIAEHEVIEVNLSHDMVGYEGVETLVYRALAKIMEQVEGGDLVVNKGAAEDLPSAEKQSGSGVSDEDRSLNTVDGFVEGYKLAEANLEALIKRHFKQPEAPKVEEKEAEGSDHARIASVTVPVTICPVYMRIQPVLAPLPFSMPGETAKPPTSGTATPIPTPVDDPHLFFILILRDPTNELVHKTLTQSMPSKWLDIPFEENEWVEDIMVQVLRSGIEIIGEEYVKGRTYGRLLKNAKLGEPLFERDDEAGGVSKEEEEEAESVRLASASAGVSA